MNTTNDDLVNPTTLQDIEGDFPSCTAVEVALKTLYLPIMYSIIFLVGFPGNVIAICVYSFKMRPWKSSTIIMLNLALTDLLYLTSLPFLIHYYASGEHWIFGEFVCKFIRFGFHFNLYSSILFLTCFSTFRYVVIVHPMKFFHIQRKRWTAVACAAVWVISLAAVSPVNFLISSKEAQNRSLCLALTSSGNLGTIRWYKWLLTSMAAFLPLLTVTLCYTLIIYTLATRLHTRACHKQKAHRLTVILLVVFYVFFLPFHVFRAARVELQLCPVSVSCHVEKQIHSACIISRPLAALNTCGNLLLYVVIGGNFQQAILSLSRCKWSKCVQQPGSNNYVTKSEIALKLWRNPSKPGMALVL
ncbi:PREDICTED: LOW QUALITY PROTEIN: 2-oxoglutarate receptor 1-like [Aptenodytes forsteri]|uniref:LOW QUALITY PROTEIN: 2-oxoglutarate receptor 1-like n=1 Tax=Aptenodytes forsteri TaxID=9233 RepID=UPI000904A5AD|nr:PREDICTED: LOW QUALITY PROTEIN: 2-oxoglutarate receptor 1-like [Aptenodytes forsteri]